MPNRCQHRPQANIVLAVICKSDKEFSWQGILIQRGIIGGQSG
jgi:hypothetical protein